MTTKAELHKEVHEWRERCQGLKDNLAAAIVRCHAEEMKRQTAEEKLRKLKHRSLKLKLKVAELRLKLSATDTA